MSTLTQQLPAGKETETPAATGHSTVPGKPGHTDTPVRPASHKATPPNCQESEACTKAPPACPRELIPTCLGTPA